MAETMNLIAQALISATLSSSSLPPDPPPMTGCESGLTQCDEVLKPNWEKGAQK